MLGRLEVWDLAKSRGYKFFDDLTDCDEIQVPSMEIARQFAREIARESGVIEEDDDEIVVYEPDGWTFVIRHAEKGVSSMKEHLKCDCPRCEGYSPEWSCDEWDRPRGALEPDRLAHNCATCRYNNSYGPYGCPVCYRVRRTLGLE